LYQVLQLLLWYYILGCDFVLLRPRTCAFEVQPLTSVASSHVSNTIAIVITILLLLIITITLTITITLVVVVVIVVVVVVVVVVDIIIINILGAK